MSKYRIQDGASSPLKNTRKLEDGYLVSDAFVARAGVQLYRGSEVGIPDMPIVRVYRPETEVRDVNSLRSFSHAPITIGHPKEDVTSRNVKDLAVGEVSTEVTWQDNKIKIPLILKDQAAIELVEGGTRELSPGYAADIVIESGTTPDGEPYDAVQKNIRVNHLAIVAKGRSGNEVRIGDDADSGRIDHDWGASPIHNAAKEKPMGLRTLLVDGLSVETTDAGAQAIEKLQTQLRDAQLKSKEDLDAKDRELAEEKAKREKAEKEKLTDSAIDAKVNERSEIVTAARLVVKDFAIEGKTNEEIRRDIVRQKLGDGEVDGRSDAYVEVRFNDLAKEATNRKPDRVIAGLRDAAPSNGSNSSWDNILTNQGITKQ